MNRLLTALFTPSRALQRQTQAHTGMINAHSEALNSHAKAIEAMQASILELKSSHMKLRGKLYGEGLHRAPEAPPKSKAEILKDWMGSTAKNATERLRNQEK